MKREPPDGDTPLKSRASNLLAAVLIAVSLIPAGRSVYGEDPGIGSLSENGVLICTNLMPGIVASVEWAPSATGPWTNHWAELDSVMVDSNGMLQVNVPVFYRVRQAAPRGMILIPAGPSVMGNCLDPGEGYDDELPLHTNYVSPFYMDRCEVTKALLDEVYQWAITNGYSFDHAGSGKAANHPACNVSWYDVVKWCNARSEKEALTPAYYTNAAKTAVYRSGQVDLQNDWVKWTAGYRLPTEAEWEKAARGGAGGHRFPWPDADTISHSRANYYSNTNAFPYDVSLASGYHPAFNDAVYPYMSPVGSFAANGYGLYDISGSVDEWCWDWYDGGYYNSSPEADPRGPAAGSIRVLRGGGWSSYAKHCRTACRFGYLPAHGNFSIGFRTVLPAAQRSTKQKE